jgi:hypothetical protein
VHIAAFFFELGIPGRRDKLHHDDLPPEMILALEVQLAAKTACALAQGVLEVSVEVWARRGHTRNGLNNRSDAKLVPHIVKVKGGGAPLDPEDATNFGG